jgi:hypothetical protein
VRILFKTSYLDDIRLFQHEGQILWYSLLGLAVVSAPSSPSTTAAPWRWGRRRRCSPTPR